MTKKTSAKKGRSIAELTEALEKAEARIEEFHNSTMELAMGISECFQVLSEVKAGNLSARVGEESLNSEEEIIASLAEILNDAIQEIELSVETISRQQTTIQELSTPILQVWDNVLVPVIGVVDSMRSTDIMERLLIEITAQQARFVILDITGVEVVDTRTADHFIKMVKASELLGTKCILTGIRPAVAQTLVEIGVDLSTITTLKNLKSGLEHCRQLLSANATVF